MNPSNQKAASELQHSLAAAVQQFKSAQRIAAATHISPDPDAIGSLLGFGQMMREMGKQVILLCDDPAPRYLDYLPNVLEIQTNLPDGFVPDLFVGLDASDPERLGKVSAPMLASDVPSLVIDHHITNLGFGTVNLVDPTWSATAEGLVEFAGALALPISANAANCLLTGLIGDTRGFSTTNTTPRSLQIGAQLMTAGGDMRLISEMLNNRRDVGLLALWGIGLTHMTLDGGVLWTVLPFAERQAGGLETVNGSGLSNLLISAEEAQIAAVFSEQNDGVIDASFRARPGYDVASVALMLGGGGHPAAAGAQLPGPLMETAQRVVGLLKGVVQREAQS